MLMATSGSPGWTLTLYMLAITFQPLFKEFEIMKKIFLRGALAMAVVSAGLRLTHRWAGQGGGEMHGPHQPMSADQRLQMMTQQLNLTSDQQTKIKPILENESTQMQSLRSDSSLSQQERRARCRRYGENTNSQIKPILNADQQTQWQQMMSHGHRGMAPQCRHRSHP